MLFLLTAMAVALAVGVLRAQAQGGLRPAEGACVLPIPAQAKVVSNGQNVDDTWSRESKTYWVCAGANLTVNRGEGNIYYVESLGRLHVSGGKHRVYLKANATLLMDWGAEVSVVRDPSASVKNESITSTPDIKDCAGLSFNYYDSPEGGCPGVIRRPPPPEPTNPNPWPDPTWPADPPPAGSSYQAMLVPISPAARPITFARSEMANARHYWVCGNGRLQLSGSNNVIFLEPGAVLQLRGDNNLIYVRNGAHVQFAGGNENLVLAEQGSDVPQGQWGGSEWDWGLGWYGPRGMRRSQMRNGPKGAPSQPPGQGPTRQLGRGTLDKDKPVEDPPGNPGDPDYRPADPPRPQNPTYQHPVGAIGPPYGRPARLRLEWLEYLEFDYRAVGFATRCP